MICYRDRSFCAKSDECSPLKHCEEQITDKDRKGAKRIGLPFALIDYSNECGKYRAKKEAP